MRLPVLPSRPARARLHRAAARALACLALTLGAAGAVAAPGAAADTAGAYAVHSMLQLNSPYAFMRDMFAAAAGAHASEIRVDASLGALNNPWISSSQWQGLDDYMQLSEQFGLPVLIDFNSSNDIALETCPPGANAALGTCGIDPGQLTGYYAEIAAVVRHTRGVIDDFEIVNEPDGSWAFQGTPQQYAGMLATAYAAVHDNDPNGRVVLGGIMTPGDAGWLSQVFATPGYDAAHKFDVANVHLRDALANLPGEVSAWRNFFAFWGDAALPLWVTETGYPSDPAYQYDPNFRGTDAASGQAEQAAFLARSLPALVLAGAARVFVTERDDMSGEFASEGLLGGGVTDGSESTPNPVPKLAYTVFGDLAAGQPLPAAAIDAPSTAPASSAPAPSPAAPAAATPAAALTAPVTPAPVAHPAATVPARAARPGPQAGRPPHPRSPPPHPEDPPLPRPPPALRPASRRRLPESPSMATAGEHERDAAGAPSVPAISPAVLGRAAARPAELREHLPGLEPERRVSDWGRSELVEAALDRTLTDFLYRHWLRVEAEGVAGVPAEGPALIVAAGGTALDAIMIAAAIRRTHSVPRPIHFATTRRLGAVPGLDMLAVKAGAVAAHPANLHRLLFDEGQLVLAFPEAARRAVHHRYRLARFTGEPVQAALRARAPIVPVAAIGAEEALPVLGRLPARLGRLPLASGLPLPAKLRLRFLEPVDPVAHGLSASAAEAERLAERLRDLIQANVLEMLGRRRSVWLG